MNKSNFLNFNKDAYGSLNKLGSPLGEELIGREMIW